MALLAPAAYCEPSTTIFEKVGLTVEIMESCYRRHGYFAGEDEIRASDLMKAFTNPDIKGVFALRGGYGSQRLLPLLDYECIQAKIFAGYSDITALHTAFNQKCGFITYHSPMAGTELKSDVDSFTLNSLFGQIMEGFCSPKLSCTPLLPKNVSGRLCGGNLSMIVSSLATPYEIDTCDKILFLEDIGEAAYKIDRMLLQLKYAGKLSDCCAIVLGSFSPETSASMSQAINEILIPIKKPLFADLPCGHCLPTATLPLGKIVEICKDGKINFQHLDS